MKRARTAAVVGLGLASLLLSACSVGAVDPLGGSSARSGATDGGERLVVGSGPSSESHVLAELYAQALTARGVPASTGPDLGSRDGYLRALSDGTVSLVPEYTGQLLLHYDENAPATTAAEVAESLPRALPSELRLGPPSRAVNQDTYVVTRRFYRQHGVTSLADLKKIGGGGFVVGGPSGLADRAYGPVGLEKIYGARLKQFKADDSPAARARDLDLGKIQVGEFSSTEVVLVGRDHVALADPQAMILPQSVVPLMRSDVAGQATVTSTLAAVQGALTTRELAALDRSVDVDQEEAAQVAGEWLTSKGLT